MSSPPNLRSRYALGASVLTLLVLGSLYLVLRPASSVLDAPATPNAPAVVGASEPETAVRPVDRDDEDDEDAVEWPADAPRTLYGRITDVDQQPVGSATIRVVAPMRRGRPTGPTLTARSDARGRFELAGVPPLVASLEVSARGYRTERFERLELPAQRRVEWDVVLEVQPGVHGVVLAAGQPAEGAWVWLQREGERPRRGGARTDDAGRFSLGWPGDGAYVLHASHGQHGRGQVEVDAPGEVHVELPGGGFIEGLVVDERGQPVESFSVSASPLTQGIGGPPAQSFDSHDGFFRLGPLAPGRLQVWAAAPGYQPAEATGVEVVAAETNVGLRLVLRRSTILVGRVTDARTGRPVEGAEVFPAEWRAGALAQSVGAFTDAQGRYQLDALPGVRTSIRVTARGYKPLLLGGVEGRAGEQVIRDFAITPYAAGDRPASELTGIGAVLNSHPEGVTIRQLVPGGPASEVLRAGDVVVQVDGQSAKGKQMAQVAQAIRGEEGSAIELWVRRGGKGEPERVVLRRGRVTMEAPHGHPPRN